MRAATLADAAARARITGAEPDGLERTLFVEAGAGSGKTRSLVERVVALVAAGERLRHVAAITFTDKAAAELRDRIRGAVEDRRRADPADRRWEAALRDIDGAAIGTLHAFAQRLLSERPIEAGLPPSVEVLDEVGSQVAFEERWQRFRTRLLDDQRLGRTLLLALAAGVQLDHLRELAVAFEANWDLVAEPGRIPWGDEEPPPVDVRALLAEIDGVCGAAATCGDVSDKLLPKLGLIAGFADRLRAETDELERLRLLSDPGVSFKPGNAGKPANWGGKGALGDLRQRMRALEEACAGLREEVAVAALHRLAVEVARFVLEAAEERRVSGRVAFHDLLVLARGLLRGPHGNGVRAAFRQRYARLLLDEFQDTDPIQVELAVLLASPDAAAGHQAWTDTEVRPGALFFVGDPKQSIYRFRRADIGLFLQARECFAGDQPVRLTTNFRTSPPVLAWVNHVFGQLIQPVDGAQPEYQPLAPSPFRQVPADGPTVGLIGAEPHDDKPSAAQLREREAADVAGAVLVALEDRWSVLDHRDGDGREHWRAARPGDITILLPARTSLGALEQALEQRHVPYRAETSSLVYATPEVRDLFAALRAVADPTDRLALVTALRSPLFGCGDDDLLTFRKAHEGHWDLTRDQPETVPAEHPVAEATAFLAQLHRDHTWLTPSEVIDRLVRDRRLFELGFADRRPRDLWRRLRFVTDQARAWSEARGGTLREYLGWAALQASDSARVAETVLPETDDDAVRIMTIHAAKGLEFPITILSGMSTVPQTRRAGVDVVWPHDPPGAPAGIRVGGRVRTEHYTAHEPLDEQLSYHERIRLLYVACTRARDHLVVSLHRKAPSGKAGESNAELLAGANDGAPHAMALDPRPATGQLREDPLVGQPAPALQVWEADRARVLAAASVRRAVSATGIAASEGATSDPDGLPSDTAPRAAHPQDRDGIDPGLVKGPRDLELPPWIKGRYGTSVGRAVHAVLQTVDLDQSDGDLGEGMVAAVAGQCAAEGVTGREAEVAALVTAALGAPSVRASRGRPRWRETYVAAPLDGSAGPVLEGYVDLLYRTDAGLVVVDYKTAASAHDLDARTVGYRLQGAAYAVALETATGEPVARVVFCYLTPDGAHERDVTDLPAAMAEVRQRVAASV
ncbi:MAG: UvrD-helicase domain-containing protein [Egibacteraceae bacterium]